MGILLFFKPNTNVYTVNKKVNVSKQTIRKCDVRY